MKVLFEDKDIIVCIKPAGVMSTDEAGGMPDLIRDEIGHDIKVRTVHRLDSVVSGLMVYALSAEAASDLTRQIENDIFKKAYYAVVEGIPKKPEGKLKDYLRRNTRERKTYVVKQPGKGAEDAALLYKVMKKADALSLVKVELITGRTHQIRAQFSSRQLPLYGDKKYGAKHTDARIALWSCSLTFEHPLTHQKMQFTAQPPAVLPWTLFDGYHTAYGEADVVREFKRREGFSDCVYAEKCGMCTYQGLAYEKQLEKKQKIAGKWLKNYCTVETLISMDEPYHYKTKAIRCFDSTKNGKILTGLTSKSKRGMVPVNRCLIEYEGMEAVIAGVRELMTKFGIEPYIHEQKSGWLKRMVIRVSETNGDMLLTLVAVNHDFKSKDIFVEEIIDKHPEIKGIILNVQPTPSPTVFGKEDRVIYGNDFIEDHLLGRAFKVTSKAYFPENPKQYEKLYETAIEYASFKGEERVLHAYAGSGLLSVCLASKVKKVLAVERYQDMLHEGMAYASENHIENIKFTCNEPIAYIDALARSHEDIQVAFIDALRSHITKEVMASVLRLAPDKIICLTDDIESLQEAFSVIPNSKYHINMAQPIDLEPYVKKVGCVICLEQKIE